MGRPRGPVTKQRTREFLRALTRSGSLHTAARESQTDPGRVLRLLDESEEFRSAALALMNDVEHAVRAA